MIRASGLKAIGMSVALLTASCASGDPAGLSTEAEGVFSARQEDGGTLDERVDTDGDGEMSEDEIQTYAREVLLEFSTCMRENGFPDFTDMVLEDFTDGGAGGSGQGRFLALMAERGVSLADTNAIPTLQTCGDDLSDLQTFAPQPSDQELEEREANVLEFAQCMRSGGVEDWPDPDFASNGGNGYGTELLDQFDLQSSEIQDAIATCRASNSGAVDLAQPDDEPADDQPENDQADAPTQDAPVERSPISPVIEGDTTGLNLATVTRRDLVQTRTLAGTLGYGELRPLPTNTTGIVTSLPGDGEIINFGEVLFTVDNEPVLLLEGSIPQYRPFRSNMDDGPDIEQLERNLVTNGFADEADLTVDHDFTGRTRDAIEALQLDLGVEETGSLELGRIVFALAPIRIGGVQVELGQSISPQVNVVQITEGDQRITVDLDADDRALVDVGTSVEIELPDGTTIAGEVSQVAAVATQGFNSQTGAAADPTIEVTVVFSTTPPANVFDAAPVEIIVADEVTANVLTVPVPALIAVSGGGHAVELVVDGGTQLVAVEIGTFVDDLVEVIGGVQEGDSVVLATAS